MEFTGFRKMTRLSRDCIITEKIDGTNAQIGITEDGEIFAGSRTRWITPEDDNHGFAAWVRDNREDLLKLGPGRHFGEWWGHKIQRGYSLKEKRFSLFDTERWGDPGVQPKCCGVVPVLYKGLFSSNAVDIALATLDVWGSKAAPGFMNPEGIVLIHLPSGVMFKKTLGGDGHKTTKERKKDESLPWVIPIKEITLEEFWSMYATQQTLTPYLGSHKVHVEIK